MIYRWASTMGERYALPIMFAALEDAESHARLCQRLLGGLPGQDSMRFGVLGRHRVVPSRCGA